MKPKLRFKGYDEDWANKSLNELAAFSRGQGYSKKDLVESGDPIFLYGRLYTKYDTFVSDIDTFTKEQPNSILSKGNEVVMPSSGETAEDIAVASAIMKENIILGGGLNIIIPDSNQLSPDFLALNLTYGSPHFDLAKKAQGKSVVHLYNSDISSTNVKYPLDNKEQREIGEYFRKLDGLIKETGKEIEKLENVKQASLQKLFPQPGEAVPQLRFKGFTGPWKEVKIREILTMERGLTFSPSDLTNKQDGILVLRSSNIIDNNLYIDPENEIYVKKEKVNIPYISNGDILFTASNGSSHLVGKHCLIECLTNSAVHGGFMLLGKTSNPYFSQSWLSAPWYTRSLESFVTGGNGALGNFQTKEFLNKSVYYPTTDEEIKVIGEYFRNLDKMISAKRKKLEKLKQIKTSCLNLMFV